MNVKAKDLINQTLCFGTLNHEDLCDIFLPMCRALGAPVPTEDFDDLEESTSGNDWEQVYYWALWEEICDALNEIAPEGTYFGGHPDDPADIGFWEEREEDEDQES